MRLKILFMGTPDFAVFSLKALVESDKNDVIGVVTQPDKPKGRGYALMPPPVKVFAEERGIPVYQPNTLRGEDFADFLKEIDPDVIVVVAYGKILPQNVLDYPKYGCINVHGSYLPQYRGAAPMQRAIIEGNDYTGATIIRMDAGIDTGDMLSKKKIEIKIDDNFEDIHDRLGVEGAELLVETIEKLKLGEIVPEKQDDSLSTYAAKIEKADCIIDFTKKAKVVHDLIRGLSPIPLAFTHLPNGKLLKVVSASLTDASVKNAVPGEVVSLNGDVIRVACADLCIDIKTVLPEGKRKMPAGDFIRGRGIAVGDILKP